MDHILEEVNYLMKIPIENTWDSLPCWIDPMIVNANETAIEKHITVITLNAIFMALKVYRVFWLNDRQRLSKIQQ